MMGEALDFGRYAPYVAAAYAASFAVIGMMIFGRRNKLSRALEAERADADRPEGDNLDGGPDKGTGEAPDNAPDGDAAAASASRSKEARGEG